MLYTLSSLDGYVMFLVARFTWSINLNTVYVDMKHIKNWKRGTEFYALVAGNAYFPNQNNTHNSRGCILIGIIL